MSDLREALDDAWEDDGNEGDTIAPASEVIEDAELSDVQDDTESDGAPEPRESLDQAERQYAPGDAPPIAEGEPAAAGDPAPIGWNPEAREGWSGIPDATKQQILQRERDIEQNMANTSTARQESQVFNQIASKYAPVMAAEGVNNPFQAIEGMFQTAAELRMGNPQQKAGRIAMMIKNYGVDIQALDALLVGETPEVNQNDQMAQLIDQRMQPVNQMMQQLAGMQQNKVQEQHEGATAQVGEFSKNAEFLADVRYDMADLMDLATKRGQNMSLQDAYERACSVHPEVSKVLQKRWEQNNLMGKQQADMSISGQGEAGSPPASNNSLGQDVRAAWDAYS